MGSVRFCHIKKPHSRPLWARTSNYGYVFPLLFGSHFHFDAGGICLRGRLEKTRVLLRKEQRAIYKWANKIAQICVASAVNIWKRSHTTLELVGGFPSFTRTHTPQIEQLTTRSHYSRCLSLPPVAVGVIFSIPSSPAQFSFLGGYSIGSVISLTTSLKKECFWRCFSGSWLRNSPCNPPHECRGWFIFKTIRR